MIIKYVCLIKLALVFGITANVPVNAKTLKEIFEQKQLIQESSTAQSPSTQNKVVQDDIKTDESADSPVFSAFKEPHTLNEDHLINALNSYAQEQYPDLELHLKPQINVYKLKCVGGPPLIDPLVKTFVLNANHTSFTAQINWCEKGPPLSIQGKVETYMTIPALSRPIHVNEVIMENDITSIQVPHSKIAKTTITQVSDLLGTAAKHGVLKPGIPISRNDVIRPFEIKKGALVTITYIKPNLVLMAKGKALSDGRMGYIIDVMNIDTNKNLKATVEGINHVFIQAVPSLD